MSKLKTYAARNEQKSSLNPQTLRIQTRLRERTKQGRKHWDLYKWMMDPYLLADALALVLANAGAAGIDGVTCQSIKGKEWAFVTELAEKMRNRAYRPRPVKRRYIPKADGKLRPLGIPTVEDRVVQRALALLLEPIYESIFLPCSFGFRPGRRAVDCAAEVADKAFRHRHVIDADIEAFFDSVKHRKLIGMLKEQIVDPRVLNLIRGILKAGMIEEGKGWQESPEGTPQGGPLSPLLANVYLHYALDARFKALGAASSHLVRYADDFVVASRTQAEMKAILRALTAWMSEAGLKLKAEKTRFVDMRDKKRSQGSKFDFLGFKFHLRAFKDNPRRFWIARQPSEKARKRLNARLREKLTPNLGLDEAKKKAEEVWYGWCEYFRYSNANRVFYRQIRSVNCAVVRYLRMKFRRQRRPVPWKKLKGSIRYLCRDIKPVRVVSDLVRQRKIQATLPGAF